VRTCTTDLSFLVTRTGIGWDGDPSADPERPSLDADTPERGAFATAVTYTWLRRLPDVEMNGEEFELSNEFATVKLRTVETRHGQRLEISSPELERSIRISPIELESLTWQDHETFTEFLETPYGGDH